MDRYIGKKLDGRYELREVIGIGGMAVVYAAYDIQEERMVAVKLLKDEYLANDDFRRRFKTESKAISVLSHPNIVKVYDVCLGDRRQYIVMELIDGITLKEYIETQKVLRWKDVVHFITQILDALKHAHDKGIVHRDVKPQNILLLADGNIKVTDFGIARFSRSASQTMTDKAIGSVHYISPEQARGEVADERADIYSAGVILYEMLTGSLPFNADSPVSVAIMQMQAAPPDPRKVNPDIPEGLAEITLRAMQKDPSNRYGSAGEMLEDIEKFKKDPEISFQYKYFEDNAKTRYVEAINKKKGVEEETAEEIEPTGYRTRSLQILFGIAIASVVASALFILGAVALKTPFMSSSKDEVDVPNLVGQLYSEVLTDSAYSNFTIEKEAEEYSDEYDKGVIFYQNPQPPKKVRAGSVLKVKVSKGAKLIPIPDLTNKKAADAQKELEDLGLYVRVTQRVDENTPIGYVIGTNPAKDTEVEKGSSVTIYVSVDATANIAVKIPTSIINQPLAEVKNILTKNNLIVGDVIEVDSTLPEGYVVSSDPEPGSVVPRNTVVNLQVSNGSNYVDTSEKVKVTVTGMPIRKFLYLVEVVPEGDSKPVATVVMTPEMNGTFTFTARSEKGGVVNYRINTNGQRFREIYVNFELEEYGPIGIDYAVDLQSGYVTSSMAASINAANSAAASSEAKTSSTTTSVMTSSQTSSGFNPEWPWGDEVKSGTVSSQPASSTDTSSGVSSQNSSSLWSSSSTATSSY